MVVDGAAGRGGAARRRTAPPPAPRRGRCSSTCPRSRRGDAARSASALAERGIALHRRAGHRLLAQGRGRHAHDHGRRRRRGLRARAAAVRGDGRARSSTPARTATAQMVKLINNALAAVERGRAGRGAARRRARPGVDLDALVEVDGRRLGRLGDARPQGRADARRTTTRRCSSSRTCSRTCASASTRPARGVAFPAAAAAARAALAAADGRGLGDDDFAAVHRGARGPRRAPAAGEIRCTYRGCLA